jgi:hypothetical protein
VIRQENTQQKAVNSTAVQRNERISYKNVPSKIILLPTYSESGRSTRAYTTYKMHATAKKQFAFFLGSGKYGY